MQYLFFCQEINRSISGTFFNQEPGFFQFLQPVERRLFTDIKFLFQYFSVNGTVMLQILSYFLLLCIFREGVGAGSI